MVHGGGGAQFAEGPPRKMPRIEGSASMLHGGAYKGFAFGSRTGVGKVRYADLSPGEFFAEYVAARRPVVIEGCIPEAEGWKGGRWTDEYLQKKAGDALVKVEWRSSKKERFGQGQEKEIKFGEFLRELERGNELMYLTTQEAAVATVQAVLGKDLGVDAAGRPRLMSAPLDRLKGDFPMRPKLMAGLVPQNMNLWMGLSRGTGSSSGLHHDFHDNLYVLLRGRKTFRLFSPADVDRMYLEGKVVKVHPNGRINYEGEDTLADGADPMAETAARAAALLDEAALRAEREEAAVGGKSRVNSEGKDAVAQAAVGHEEKDAEDRVATAEDEVEEALQAVLDAECTGGDGSEGFSSEFSEDDGEEEEGEMLGGMNGDLLRQALEAGMARSGSGDRKRASSSMPRDHRDGDAENCDRSHVSSKKIRTARKKQGPPSNFSRVDPSLPRSELEQNFPLFVDALERLVEVQAGQMLYLPAGWFHEVSSIASDDGHMALNYWFHPPDAGSGGDGDNPYKSRFWQDDWAAREGDVSDGSGYGDMED